MNGNTTTHYERPAAERNAAGQNYHEKYRTMVWANPFLRGVALSLVACAAWGQSFDGKAAGPAPNPVAAARIKRQPLVFEPNRGQAP